MLPFFLTPWFWEFFFANPEQHHFYEAAVWGNVVAVLPLAALGAAGFLWHHYAVKDLHRKVDELTAMHADHDRHLKQIIDVLDPDTDGGLADVLDRLDPTTPGGLAVIDQKLDALTSK